MTKSVKTPNWTPAQIEIIETFASQQASKLIDAESIKTLAENDAFKAKTVPMLRSKVVNLGYYKKAEKARVVGAPVAKRKLEYVSAIEIFTSLPAGSLASLEKASKPELEKLNAALVALNDTQAAEEPTQES